MEKNKRFGFKARLILMILLPLFIVGIILGIIGISSVSKMGTERTQD